MPNGPQRIMTKRDTPIAKRSAPPAPLPPAPSMLAMRNEVKYFPPPIERSEPDEEDEGDKTHPMPEPWFQDHDALYGRQT